MKVWFDGRCSEDAHIAISAGDRGLLLGDGLFETILVLGGKAVWRTAHLARMAQAAQVLALDYPAATLENAIETLLESVAQPAEGILRLTLTRGPGARGLLPQGAGPVSVLCTLAPLPDGIFFKPVTLAHVGVRRNDTAPSSRMKTISCADMISAAREAAAAGAEDGLLRNTRGALTCSTIGNIFVSCERGLLTPPLADGVLPGIARSHLLTSGAMEESLTGATADCVVITNSVRLARPAVSLDGRGLASRSHWHFQAAVRTLARSVEADCGIDPCRHRACFQD